MKQKLIKALTLSLFIGSISIFILYRTGKMDNQFQSSPNGGTLTNTSDTNAIVIPDSLLITPMMMASSKSIILLHPNKRLEDTAKIDTTDTSLDSMDIMLMGSSKSMRIIEKPFTIDSSKIKSKHKKN